MLRGGSEWGRFQWNNKIWKKTIVQIKSSNRKKKAKLQMKNNKILKKTRVQMNSRNRKKKAKVQMKNNKIWKKTRAKVNN